MLELNKQESEDLGINILIKNAALFPKKEPLFKKYISKIPVTESEIKLRQDLAKDLFKNKGLRHMLAELLPRFELMNSMAVKKSADTSTMYKVSSRLAELECFTELVNRISEHAKTAEVSSSWMKELFSITQAEAAKPDFQRLCRELPGIAKRMRGIRSVSIGVNLDKNNIPFQATLLDIHTEPFRGKGGNLVSKLFGGTSNSGIAQLHSVPSKSDGDMLISIEDGGYGVNPMMVPLFKDLDEILKKTSGSIDKEIKQYMHIYSGLLGSKYEELHFTISMLDFLESFSLPLCFPHIMSAEKRTLEIEDCWNINLAVDFKNENRINEVVTNDVQLTPEKGFVLLTGPNSGGKTVYAVMASQAQILAQLGLPVPGSAAYISPVNRVLTHFQIEERPGELSGRFGEEIQRMKEIIESLALIDATDGTSLLIMNESFSSTNTGESIVIAEDLLKYFAKKGVRGIFATHFHELASKLPLLKNENNFASGFISLVVRRGTHKVQEDAPEGHSYAKELAKSLGLDLDALKA